MSSYYRMIAPITIMNTETKIKLVGVIVGCIVLTLMVMCAS